MITHQNGHRMHVCQVMDAGVWLKCQVCQHQHFAKYNSKGELEPEDWLCCKRLQHKPRGEFVIIEDEYNEASEDF